MSQPGVPTLPLAARPPLPEPTHPCIRCGRQTTIDRALCEECNPLELAQPSATQVHGIALVGIVAFVAVLAVLGRLTLAGTGPFSGFVDGVAAVPGGLSVTLLVRNEGTRSAATTCRIVPDTRPVGGPGELVQTPTIPAGGSQRFAAIITRLGDVPIGLAADCQSP